MNYAAVLIAATVLAGQAESSRESLNDLGAMFVGEWTCQMTVDFDLEGVCEKGDKIDIVTKTEWVLDKLALVRMSTYSVNGKEVAQGAALVTWNAPKKQIRSYYTDSIGSTIQSTWRKRGDSWVCQDRGLAGDGRKISTKVVLKVNKDGDAYTVTTTERVMGDEKLPDKKSTYKRSK